jgi:hypothetical protein
MHVAPTGMMRNEHTQKRQVQRCRSMCGILLCLQMLDVMDRICVIQDRFQRWAFISTRMNFQVP